MTASPPPHRGVAAYLVALALAISPLSGQPDTTTPPSQRTADRNRLDALDKAWRSGDFATVTATLDTAWETDRNWALSSSRNLATGNLISARPLGIAQLVAHASATDLAACLAEFSPSKHKAERRTLAMLAVPAFASQNEAALPALVGFLLRDQDRILRAAGASVIAASKNAELAALLLPLLRENPTFKPSWDGDEEDILQSRCYGAFEAIWGVRPRSPTEAAALKSLPTLAAAQAPAKEPPPEPPTRLLVAEQIRGKPYFSINHFMVSFEFNKGRSGDPQMALAIQELTSSQSEEMAAAAAPIFGPLFIASPRLIIADRSRYSSVGGNSFRPGSATGNQIALLESLPESMAATVRHECVHVYHGASFEDQPRWLSEGLAESLSASTDQSVWTAAAIRQRNFDDELDNGVFAELVGWKGPASSGGREARLYAMAHLAVDYLRFGPHAAPEARLHLFMAKIANHESDRSTLEKLYGGTIKDVDRALAEWARTR